MDEQAPIKDALINSRLLGHTRHPTITDVPLGSWTVTLVADVLELAGQSGCETTGDLSLAVGLGASLLAAAGGVADLSETYDNEDRKLGMTHGILQGISLLLYGGSLAARRTDNRRVGTALSVTGFGTQLAASIVANRLAERRRALEKY